MSDPFMRSITFSIAATATSPGMQITAVETADGKLQFTVDVISTTKLTGDLRGLFFDFNRDPLLSGLKVSGSNITAFDTIDVTNLGNGVTMQNAGAPYDVGVAFGSANLGKDDIKHQTFTLYSLSYALTLDDIAGVEFGVRLTSVGSPTGSRTGSSKLVITATAAPDAHDDTFNIFEDGQSGVDHPATAASALVFAVLGNDSDADHNTLLITAIDTPAHGSLTIVDGSDADTLAGDALRYVPTADYAGPDQFRYAVSDGHGGTDFAWVYVNIAAVADVPTVAYTMGVGPLLNQVLVHVTATAQDVDGSEYIDRFEFSGLPVGVQVAAANINPADQPSTLARDFVLTLPDTQTWDFDFTVNAIAKEMSNGDEESLGVTAPINSFPIFEDGQAGLSHPATASEGVRFDLLTGLSAGTHSIISVGAPAHGTVTIVDGADAGNVAGDALLYTPTADYAGTDDFGYTISDGQGGTTAGWVHVNVAAVADVPDIACEVLPGDAINQIIIHVTASDTDIDGSEYIDRFEFSGLPDGVQVLASGLNPADQPHMLVRDFVLTLPDDQDWHFDFTVTAVAKEGANGDEQAASVSQAIDYNYESTQTPLSFTADNQSIWGEGASSTLVASDTQSQTFGFTQSWTDPSGIFGFGVQAEATPGLNYSVSLHNGTVDANFDYSLTLDSRYNETTDQLVISSGVVLTGGDFTTSAMNGTLAATAFVQLLMNAGFTFDFTDYVPDAAGYIPLLGFDQTVELPVFSTSETAATSLLGNSNLAVPIPINITDPFGNHLAINWPAGGSEAAPMAPDGSMTGIVDGSNFANVGIDLDAFLTVFAGFPNMVINFNPLAPLFSATIDLLDLNMNLGLDFNQSFTLKPLGLDATITFEDGRSFDFDFGQDFTLGDAAAIDAAGDADGQIDYTIAIDQKASFSNLTAMDMDLSFPFEVLKVSGSYDLLGLLTGTFNVPPVYSNPLAIAIPPGTLYDDTFALDFVGQSIAVVA